LPIAGEDSGLVHGHLGASDIRPHDPRFMASKLALVRNVIHGTALLQRPLEFAAWKGVPL